MRVISIIGVFLLKMALCLVILYALYASSVYERVTLAASQFVLKHILGYGDVLIALEAKDFIAGITISDILCKLQSTGQSWKLASLQLFSNTMSFLILGIMTVHLRHAVKDLLRVLEGFGIIWLGQIAYFMIISVSFFTFGLRQDIIDAFAEYLYLVNLSLAFLVWASLFRSDLYSLMGKAVR